MTNPEFRVTTFKTNLLNYFRANFNSSDPLSRVASKTYTGAGTGAKTVFPLHSTKLAFVSSVTVDGVSQELGVDYTINWSGTNIGSVQFTSAPDNGAVVIIGWGQADNGNFIYPDFPRRDLSMASYPRVGFKFTANASPGGFGGGTNYAIKYDILLQIKIVDYDTSRIDSIVDDIQDFIKKNAKNLPGVRYIEPQAFNEYDNFDDNTDLPFSKTISYIIPEKYECVTFA